MRILVSGSTRTYGRLYPDHPGHLGRLLEPQGATRPPTHGVFAADNAYSHWDAPAFLRLLGKVAGKPGLLWVACPDVVGDAKKTLDRFGVWLPVLREAGVPAALVGQDGLEDLGVPWGDFAAYFVGGGR